MALPETDTVVDMYIYRDEPFVFIHDEQNGKMIAVEDIPKVFRKRAQAGVTCVPEFM